MCVLIFFLSLVILLVSRVTRNTSIHDVITWIQYRDIISHRLLDWVIDEKIAEKFYTYFQIAYILIFQHLISSYFDCLRLVWECSSGRSNLLSWFHWLRFQAKRKIFKVENDVYAFSILLQSLWLSWKFRLRNYT